MAAVSVVLYQYAEGTDAVRDELRPSHRAFLDSRDGLLLSGPTAAPLPALSRPAIPAATYFPGFRLNTSAFIGGPPW